MPVSRPFKPPPASRPADQPATSGPGAGITTRTTDRLWVELLLRLHRQVRRAAVNASRQDAGTTNPKGDEVKLFDLAANDAGLAVLRESPVPLVVDSEECGRLEIGSGKPRHRLVLDPVDGSDNWARGLPLAALSCAVLPIDAPLHPDWVEAALVGPLEQQTPLTALKGAGAWRGTARLETSGVRSIAEAMVSVELNHLSPSPGLGLLMAGAKGVRCYGCASRALALIATGAIDAHVDVRGRLTAESYLAAARLVIEAGGWLAGLDGSAVPAATGLTDGIGLIAAASRDLCDEIVELLSREGQ